ncbi:hypothetical protein [Mucilaginibacter dorajii]|uniref:Auto-transporter adhesin head GIN domain-containing protein n=1 Tax=Mucilaginibacter dorajii TaxID=692994 RepID=A0ABP7R874_9SPHI|nr:hypothetical protein [Mucilaginibacter dorajii]MCS3737391.1 hypothetical protein [Mucilaginibacter dorajii]
MKTSTKLIIILFTCIPVSLLAYNFILKAEYQKGNFVRDLYPQDNTSYIIKPGLPDFKHIVIEGSLNLGEGRSETWMARVWIGGNNATQKSGNSLSVIEELKDNLNATVKHDTLFISFHVTGKFDNTATTWNHGNDIVKIYCSQVKSVSIRYANVTIGNNPGTADFLKLIVGDGSNYNIQRLHLKSLAVIAKDSSYLNILKNNQIGTLSYSLQGKSTLNVDENPARQYIAERVDSAAKIQLTGKASVLQKQLR